MLIKQGKKQRKKPLLQITNKVIRVNPKQTKNKKGKSVVIESSCTDDVCYSHDINTYVLGQVFHLILYNIELPSFFSTNPSSQEDMKEFHLFY